MFIWILQQARQAHHEKSSIGCLRLEDCKSHKLEIVITKDVSRFGRDTVEVLYVFNQLKELGVRVIFEGNSLDTANTSSDLMVAVMESIAQAENESRSENIK